MLAESRLQRHKYPLLGTVARRVRIGWWLSLPYVFGWLPLLLRFSILVLVEAAYNLYRFLVRPPHADTYILTHLQHEGARSGVAIVTGGTSGIGKEIARQLVQAGYHVHLPARSLQKAEAVASELCALGKGSVTVHRCDVSSKRELKEFALAFRAASDRLDILVSTLQHGRVSSANHLSCRQCGELLGDLCAERRRRRVAHGNTRPGDICSDHCIRAAPGR